MFSTAYDFGTVDSESYLESALESLQRRLSVPDTQLQATVAEIIASIRTNRAEALVKVLTKFALKFDATEVKGEFYPFVSPEEMASATLDSEQEAAIELAIERVRRFHQVQKEILTRGMTPDAKGSRWTMPVTRSGDSGFEGQRLLPVRRAGIYVPGGLATYPSSLIMNAVPAMVAGVQEVAVATPARPDGTISQAVLVTARKLGIRRIFKAGGASGIATLAFGHEGFAQPADVIAGPGNQYVNEAKRQLWGIVGIDGYAGPSEVLVVADDAANPRYAAADLLTQIEHAPDNIGWLITLSKEMRTRIESEIKRQLEAAPRRAILEKALRNLATSIVVRNKLEAIFAIDSIAPEHLSLHVANPEMWTCELTNCSCITEGPFTPQSAGDFIAGPSHTLPTAGGARFASPTNVMTFMKFASISRMSQQDLLELTPAIETFAAMEGLPAHGFGATIRQEGL